MKKFAKEFVTTAKYRGYQIESQGLDGLTGGPKPDDFGKAARAGCLQWCQNSYHDRKWIIWPETP